MVSRIEQLEARIAANMKRPHPRLTVEGYEVPDSVPVAIGVQTTRVDNLTRRIRDVLKSERMRHEAMAAGFETFEEADDFNIPDDPLDPTTPYEVIFEPPLPEEKDDGGKAKSKSGAERVGEDRGGKAVDRDEADGGKKSDSTSKAGVSAGSEKAG